MTRRPGIKRKILYGCIVLCIILFFSSIISIFEYVKMNDYVSEVITDNIRSINSARNMLSAAEQYNINLMNGMVLENAADTLERYPVVNDDNFVSSFTDIGQKFLTPQERSYADSVRYAYAAYMQVVAEAEYIWQQDYTQRQQWFFNRLQPVYMKFRGYMSQLTQVCQDALVNNSQSLQDSFYRSLMPGFISVIFGIVLVLLFNYFINYSLINPLLKISRGIKGYRQAGRTYDIDIDSDDELKELNDNVKDIIDLNNSYKKQLSK